MRHLVLLFALFVAASPAVAQTNPYAYGFRIGEDITDTTVAAIVSFGSTRDTLTADEFQNQMMGLAQQNPMALAAPAQAHELRRSIVESFAMLALLTDVIASDPSLAVDTERVSLEIEQIRQGMSEEQFNEQLAAAGMTMDSVRILLGLRQQQQQLFERWAEAVPLPTDAEAYDFAQRMSEEVKVAHIIFATRGIDPSEYAAKERLAALVLDSIRNGADFAAMARRHSDDGTAATGGVIDYFTRTGYYDHVFKKAAFALYRLGELAPAPVQTAFGFHIIQLIDRRMGEVSDLETYRRQLHDKRKSDAVRARLRALVAERGVTVRLHPALVDADLNDPLVEDPRDL